MNKRNMGVRADVGTATHASAGPDDSRVLELGGRTDRGAGAQRDTGTQMGISADNGAHLDARAGRDHNSLADAGTGTDLRRRTDDDTRGKLRRRRNLRSATHGGAVRKRTPISRSRSCRKRRR